MRHRLFIFAFFLIFASSTEAVAEEFFYDAEERNFVQLNAEKLSVLQKKSLRMESVREVSPPYTGNRKLFIPVPQGMVNYDSLKPTDAAVLRRGFANALSQSAVHRLDAIYFLKPIPQKEVDIPPFARLAISAFPYPSDLDGEIKSLKEIFTSQEFAQLTVFAEGKNATLDKSLLDKVTNKITSVRGLQFVLAYSMDEMLDDDVITLTVLSLMGWRFGAGDHTSVTAVIQKYFYWPKPEDVQSAQWCYSYMQSEMVTVPGVFKKLTTEAVAWGDGFKLVNP